MPELHLHGPPLVTLDDGRTLPLAAREAALLARPHRGGPAPRAALAGLLWPGGDEAKARANLRQTLVRLKRAFGALLAEHDGTLRLAQGVRVAAMRGRLLGPLEFDDAPELAAWLAAERDAEQRDRLRLGLATARERIDAGALDGALAAADALLADDPAVEEAHRLRMEVFYLRGDRAAALAAWDECRHALRQAFGVAPGEATNRLGREVLDSEAAPPRAAGAAPRLPLALRRPLRLVGRADALARTAQALAGGRGVVVSGPGGIGKSRLLAEATRTLEPAVAVSARPGDALLPGALASRLVAAALERFEPELDKITRDDLARLVPGSGAALVSAAEHRRVLDSVARALAACARRGLHLVVVDDLQFADPQSLEALAVLVGGWLAEAAETAGAAGSTNALPLFGCRADELGEAGRALLALLERSGRALRIELAPLDATALHELVQGLPWHELAAPVDRDALAAALAARVGGNPAFVLEALKALWLDGFAGWVPGAALPVPDTLVESVRRRLQRLGAEALQLAQLAAVAQGEFSLTLAGAAFARAPLALAPLFGELEAAQVFHGTGFGHDLVAEAVERSLPGALRAGLHRLVAEHLAARGQAAPAATVAHHFDAAGDAAAALPWHRAAAEAAGARWRMAEAARHHEAAARTLEAHPERAGAGEAAAAWRAAARRWAQANHDAAAATALDRAGALAATPADRLRVQSQRVAQLINARQPAEAAAQARELVRALPPYAAHFEPRELAEAVRFVCAAAPYGVPIDEAESFAAALRPAVAAGGARALAELQAALGAALHWDARPRAAAVELEAAWAGSEGDVAARIGIGNRLARVRHSLGDLPGALAIGEATVALGERHGVTFGLGPLLSVLALMAIARGQAAAGWARLQGQAGGEAGGDGVVSRALAALAVGCIDEAAATLAHAERPGRPGFELWDLGLWTARARLARARGEPLGEALAALRALAARPLPRGPALQLEATCAALDPAAAAVPLSALLGALRARGMRALLRCALQGAARGALAAGRRDEALAHMHEALALADAVDLWCEEPADLWCSAHEVLAACGRPDEARAVLQRGAAWVQAGSAQWADAAARSAWCAGHPRHRWLLEHAAAGRGPASR
jgi:DNA-binding SARP family transcriptional activator